MYVVFLNGPSKVGKTTIGLKLVQLYPETYILKNMATPLKAGLHALLQFSDAEIKNVERIKDMEYEIGNYEYKLRDLYISLSEAYLKRHFGPQVFGHLMVKSLGRDINNGMYNFDDADKVILITDCGFADETFPLIRLVTNDKCLLIRLHGQDLNFDGDSRDYILSDFFHNCRSLTRYENDIPRTVNEIHETIKSTFNL